MRWQPIGSVDEGPRLYEEERDADASPRAFRATARPVDELMVRFNAWWTGGCRPLPR